VAFFALTAFPDASGVPAVSGTLDVTVVQIFLASSLLLETLLHHGIPAVAGIPGVAGEPAIA